MGQEKRQRRPLPASYALGTGAGVLVGLLTPILPTVAFVFVLVALVTIAIALARNDAPRAVFACGILVAVGGYLAYGAISTIVACSKTDDFCGRANVWPLVLAVLATLGAGVFGAAIAAFGQRPQVEPHCGSAGNPE